MKKIILAMVENIVGKRGNAGYVICIFIFPTMFSTGFFMKVVKSRDCFGKELRGHAYVTQRNDPP